MNDYARRRQNRTLFMQRLYDEVDGSVSTFVNAFELGEAVNIAADEVTRVIEYLEEKRLLAIDDHRLGIIRITARGVDYVETRSE